MSPSISVDSGGGGEDSLGLTIVLWGIRILLPLVAAALWLKFSSPDEKTTAPSLSTLASGCLSYIWPGSHRSYTVAQILRYRQTESLSKERPENITSLAPQERRHLGRKTDEGEASVHVYNAPSGGLLGAHGGGMERDGPRPGTFRNGARASLRREMNSPQTDPWLPTADASQLGVTPHSTLAPPHASADTVHGGHGMQMHGGGLISAAAYQRMKNAKRSPGGDDVPASSYTNSPKPYTTSPTPLSLTQALSAAFENNNSYTLKLPSTDGAATTNPMSALRSLTPLLSKPREPLFESPALHTSHPRPHTAVAQGDTIGQSHENSIHHVNSRSPPLGGGESDSSPPSFITANRDAVIELRKLLSSPNLPKAKEVLERLQTQGFSIAPQTYTLLVTVAILCGCKDFARVCAKDMSQAGYTLSDALQSKLQNMEEPKVTSAATTKSQTPDNTGTNVDLSKTKLMANAPVFTPSAVGATVGHIDTSATTSSRSGIAFPASGKQLRQQQNQNTGLYAPPVAPGWLLPSNYGNTTTPHDFSMANGSVPHPMGGGGARVVPMGAKQQQGPLAWLPPQHARHQQNPRDASPPIPDSSPPPSDMLPHRRPVGPSAPSSPDKSSSENQRPSPVSGGDGGAKHFQKAVSQLTGPSSTVRKGARRSPDGAVGPSANRRPKSTWRKKTEAT